MSYYCGQYILAASKDSQSREKRAMRGIDVLKVYLCTWSQYYCPARTQRCLSCRGSYDLDEISWVLNHWYKVAFNEPLGGHLSNPNASKQANIWLYELSWPRCWCDIGPYLIVSDFEKMRKYCPNFRGRVQLDPERREPTRDRDLRNLPRSVQSLSIYRCNLLTDSAFQHF